MSPTYRLTPVACAENRVDSDEGVAMPEEAGYMRRRSVTAILSDIDYSIRLCLRHGVVGSRPVSRNGRT